jgi:hypothetical protein
MRGNDRSHKKIQVEFYPTAVAGRENLAAACKRPYLKRQTGDHPMSDQANRFLGDTIGRTIVKLLVVSLIVGFVMSAFHWYPIDVFYAIQDFFRELWRTGFAALGSVGRYLLLGATIVIPAFIILRLLNYRR